MHKHIARFYNRIAYSVYFKLFILKRRQNRLSPQNRTGIPLLIASEFPKLSCIVNGHFRIIMRTSLGVKHGKKRVFNNIILPTRQSWIVV